MKKKLSVLILFLFIINSFSKPLNIAILWHQHQPDYKFNGIYQAPWVRLHSIKDYVDMASVLDKYQKVKLNINLVPSLMNQIDDHVFNNAQDRFTLLMRKSLDELTFEDKKFILERSFDINWDNVIKKYSYYYSLLKKRGEKNFTVDKNIVKRFSNQEFRDLLVWFNLAWFDPDFKDELKYFFEKEKAFNLTDIETLLNFEYSVMAEIIPLHRRLLEQHKLEITTTPYYHPILPLIKDTENAKSSFKGIKLSERFSYPEDANLQVKKAVESYRMHFGKNPAGMWPAEGSVSKDVIDIFRKNGINYILTDEEVLGKSLGLYFNRDEDNVPIDVENMYRPYIAKGYNSNIVMFFRDRILSDNLGFEYSKMTPEKAVEEIESYLYKIKNSVDSSKDHVVTIVLDGENAWENYENDGKAFFKAFYDLFENNEDFRTVTFSDYLKKCNNLGNIENLWSGSWIASDFTTWIGEDEENIAWDYLKATRKMLEQKYSVLSKENKLKVTELMLKAEGSDWFWWYGTDQESSNDEFFDEMFRGTLKEIYTLCGEKSPEYLEFSIITEESSSFPLKSYFSSEVDGIMEKEWENAERVDSKNNNGVMKASDLGISSVFYTTDQQKVYLFVKFGKQQKIDKERLYIYIDGIEKKVSDFIYSEGKDGIEIEINKKISKFAVIYKSDKKNYRVPENSISVKYSLSSGIKIVKKYKDIKGDDNGKGKVIYPTNNIFKKGMFDLEYIKTGEDKENCYFIIKLANMDNVWNSPIGLSTAVIEIYINENIQDETLKNMYSQKNVFTKGKYSYMLFIEGWTQFLISEKDKKDVIKALNIKKDPITDELIVRVSKKYLNIDMNNIGITASVYGQDGMASDKIRKVNKEVEEWVFGGGNGSLNIIDILDNGNQQEILNKEKIVIPFINR